MRKLPYISKIDKIGNIVVWLVDGKFVRNHIDIDFTNYGHHYTFNQIPENEFWIEKAVSIKEIKFFLDHLMIEYNLMKQGKDFDYAFKIANQKEQSERNKYFNIKYKNQYDLKKVYKERLLTVDDKKFDYISVWLVNGKYVRNYMYINYVEGGHGYVYDFIPKNEIWIDNCLDKSEISYIIIHEYEEMLLMRDKGLKYELAHKKANKIEYSERQKDL